MPVLEIDNVTKRYGEFLAVENVSLDVDSSECCGLIGPNGAGKSTLMRIVAGVLRNFGGSVRVFGTDVRTSSSVAKRAIGYLPEEPSLYTRPRAVDLLDYFGRLYGLKGNTRQRAQELLEFVGLEKRARDRVGTFSKGMRQRLAIARALMHDPGLLLLDEPTMGLDPATADRVRGFILDQRDRGKTIVICTHYMDEAEELCDSVGIIDLGRLVKFGSVREIKELCNRESDLIEVALEDPRLSDDQVSALRSCHTRPGGVVCRADLESAFEVLRPNGIISIRRVQPSLKDSFVLLTEGDADSAC